MAWLAGFDNREELEVSNTNIDGNLTDQAIRVKITAYAAMSNAKANGFDIRFTLSDGVTLFDYERESWSGGGGAAVTGEIWATSDFLAAAPTSVFIYWGNAGAVDGENKNLVWDPNFLLVAHLNGNLNDSTVNGNNLTASGGGVTSVTGKIANGYEFDLALSEYAFINSAIKDGYPITMEILFKTTFPVAWQALMTQGDVDFGSTYEGIFATSAEKVAADANADVGDKPAITVNSYLENIWHYAVGIFASNSSRTAYLDVDVANKGTNLDLAAMALDRFSIGAAVDATPANFFSGILDEVRVSGVSRSEDYLKFVWANIDNVGNEITWQGAESQVLEIIAGSGAVVVTGSPAILTLSEIVVYSNMKAHLDRNLNAKAHLDRNLNATARIDDN